MDFFIFTGIIPLPATEPIILILTKCNTGIEFLTTRFLNTCHPTETAGVSGLLWHISCQTIRQQIRHTLGSVHNYCFFSSVFIF